jgi:hypothetical protein
VLADANPATPGRRRPFWSTEGTENVRIKIAAITAAVSALALSAGPAQAALIETGACDGSALSQPFAQWGDSANYKLAPGGDFENGTAGWTLRNGARVGSGSESFGVTGAVGSRSLVLPPGASATTPAFCVNFDHPSYRFFSKSSGGLLGLILPVMTVELVYHDNVLGLVGLPLGLATPSSKWKPSARLLTLAEVAGLVDNGEANLSLRFTSIAGTWSVDDVFVDPYARG